MGRPPEPEVCKFDLFVNKTDSSLYELVQPSIVAILTRYFEPKNIYFVYIQNHGTQVHKQNLQDLSY